MGATAVWAGAGLGWPEDTGSEQTRAEWTEAPTLAWVWITRAREHGGRERWHGQNRAYQTFRKPGDRRVPGPPRPGPAGQAYAVRLGTPRTRLGGAVAAVCAWGTRRPPPPRAHLSLLLSLGQLHLLQHLGPLLHQQRLLVRERRNVTFNLGRGEAHKRTRAQAPERFRRRPCGTQRPPPPPMSTAAPGA